MYIAIYICVRERYSTAGGKVADNRVALGSSPRTQRHRLESSKRLCFAEASRAPSQSQAADHLPRPRHLINSTTSLKAAAVAIHLAPFLCRLLHVIPYFPSLTHHLSHPRPAHYHKHVRQGRSSHSLQPAPCGIATSGTRAECAFDIARGSGHRGATERQCSTRAGRCRRRTAFNGLDVGLPTSVRRTASHGIVY